MKRKNNGKKAKATFNFIGRRKKGRRKERYDRLRRKEG